MHKLMYSNKSSQSLAINDCSALILPTEHHKALCLRKPSCLESQQGKLSSLISLLTGLANRLTFFYKHLICELIVFTFGYYF